MFVPMDSGSVAVQTEGLAKVYKSGKVSFPALQNITCTIKRGEVVALLGPSGSGKSTLLNLIAGLDRPTDGKLVVQGQDIAKLKDKAMAAYRQQTVGMVFQSFNLLPHLTVEQNLMLPVLLSGASASEGKQRLHVLAERVGLTPKLKNRPTELSGGEQQRVAIVRALMNTPSILLADEPTGNLDSKTGADVVRLLLDIAHADGMTLVIVTHDERVAEQTNRRLHLMDGSLVDGGNA